MVKLTALISHTSGLRVWFVTGFLTTTLLTAAPASAQSAPEPDDEAVLTPAEPDFVVVNLPSTLRLPLCTTQRHRAGSEADGSGTATLTFNLTRDSAGNITAATLDATVSVTDFPPGMALTASHIHPGAAGVNGGILVNLGSASGEVSFATGSGSFTKRGVSMTVDQANSIMGNPAGFYLNIHTASNPGGVARGQLARVQ